MFVRFRVRNGRLVSLVESRRVRQRHVADLGSIEKEPSHAAWFTTVAAGSPHEFAAAVRLSRLCCFWHRRRTVLIAANTTFLGCCAISPSGAIVH
jgi:hypothetical protein